MVCPLQHSDNSEVLLDYCARRLDSERMAAMRTHLAECTDCSRFAQSQETLWSALDDWDAEPISPSFDRKLAAHIAAAERRRFWTRIFGDSLGWKPALSFGAACATLAFVLMLYVPDQRQMPDQRPSAPLPATPRTAPAETLEPEQIERSLEDLEMLHQFSMPAQTY
jgi:hypothetical protein